MNLSASGSGAVSMLRCASLRRPALLRAGVRRLFIQTESTPNPEALKFIPGKPVLESGTRDFRSLKEAQASPLARRLFAAEGVASVFLSVEFVTVGKSKEADWLALKPLVFGAIMDHYAAGEPALNDGDGADEEVDSLTIRDDDSEVVQMIKELLEMRIRPSVQEDGGDIVYRGFDEETGIVELQMQGSCAGCPSSSVTLQAGIENMLRHYIPEVKEVRDVGNDADELDENEGFEVNMMDMVKTKPPPSK
mmetsp:Transcript_5837/g.8556  ORF Transcript_5837/g.8556 Transcript_5837/m.8556 type:complete len:250 (+) Transcript_5837:2-751(+)